MLYLLKETDLGRAVEVHVPTDDPEEYVEKNGYLVSFDEQYVYVKYPEKNLAMAEMPEWCFWANGLREN